MKKLLTLALILDQERILLGYKKRGFGQGKWNGFGGKVQPGESMAQAFKREVLEEIGITIDSFELCAHLTFTFEGEEDVLEVQVGKVTAWHGEPMESEEMRPQWFAQTDIPYTQMWKDDQYWLPQVLAGKTIVGTFHFRGTEELLSWEVNEVAELL